MLRRLFALVLTLFVVACSPAIQRPIAPVLEPGPSYIETTPAPAPASSHGPRAAQDTGPGRAVVERGHRLGFSPSIGSSGQVQVAGSNGELAGTAPYAFSVSGETLPSSGDLRIPNTALVRAYNGSTGDTTVATVDSNNNLWIGVDSDANGHPAETLKFYPAGNTFFGSAGTTHAVFTTGGLTLYGSGDSLTFGNTGAATAGLLRLPSAVTQMSALNHAGSANISLVKTDASDTVILSDYTNANAAIVGGSSYVTLWTNGGSSNAEFDSHGVWTISHVTTAPSSGLAGYGQYWTNSASRPNALDASGNRLEMSTFVVDLAADASTTLGTAQNTNLTWTMAASDEWAFDFQGSATCSTSNGIKLAINGPSGATLNAEIFGMSSSGAAFTSNFLTSLSTLSSAFITTSGGAGIIHITGRIKGDGTHSGAVTLQEAAASAGDTATLKAGFRVRAWAVTAEL